MKKNLLRGLLLMIFPLTLAAQDQNTKLPTFQNKEVSHFVEWVQSQLKFPAGYDQKNVNLFFEMTVKSDGTLSDISLVKGQVDAYSDAVLTILRQSPKWEPGLENGQPCDVRFVLPVNFMGEGTKESETEEFTMATFRGGDVSTFSAWAAKNVRYPQDARRKKLSGKVFVGFTIDESGTVQNVTCLRYDNPLFIKPALEVVEKSPRWEPGTKEGKPIAMSFTIPIFFQAD